MKRLKYKGPSDILCVLTRSNPLDPDYPRIIKIAVDELRKSKPILDRFSTVLLFLNLLSSSNNDHIIDLFKSFYTKRNIFSVVSSLAQQISILFAEEKEAIDEMTSSILYNLNVLFMCLDTFSKIYPGAKDYLYSAIAEYITLEIFKYYMLTPITWDETLSFFETITRMVYTHPNSGKEIHEIAHSVKSRFFSDYNWALFINLLYPLFFIKGSFERMKLHIAYDHRAPCPVKKDAVCMFVRKEIDRHLTALGNEYPKNIWGFLTREEQQKMVILLLCLKTLKIELPDPVLRRIIFFFFYHFEPQAEDFIPQH